ARKRNLGDGPGPAEHPRAAGDALPGQEPADPAIRRHARHVREDRRAIPGRRAAGLDVRRRHAGEDGMNTKQLTAVIADDGRLLREQLKARLAAVWPELEIRD